jgi:lipoate-protein ligase A
VAAGLIVVSGATALGLTSFASAQVNDQPSAQVVVTNDTTAPSITTAPSTDVESKSKGGHRGGPAKFATEDLAGVLKLTATELQTELKAGKSLAAIAEAQKVDVADVKAQLTKDFTAHLAEEVTAGKHTQAEADAKLTEFATRVDDMVNNVRPARGGMGGHRGGPAKFATEDLAGVLKLTATELQTELKAGKSLAAIAEAQKVDVADVKAQLTKDFTAHLAEEVTAGKHTQAETDAKLTEFATRVDDMVNNVRPARGGMGGHKGGRMGGHMNQAPTTNGTVAGTNASFNA